jgi:competence protein ComGC
MKIKFICILMSLLVLVIVPMVACSNPISSTGQSLQESLTIANNQINAYATGFNTIQTGVNTMNTDWSTMFFQVTQTADSMPNDVQATAALNKIATELTTIQTDLGVINKDLSTIQQTQKSITNK